MTWTLVIFIVVGGPSIVIPEFHNPDDCKFIGQLYKDYVDPTNPRVQFQCNKMMPEKKAKK